MTVSYPIYFTSDVPNYKQMCQDTVAVYTQAVRYLADVIAKEWANVGGYKDNTCTAAVEGLTHCTKTHPDPAYDFDVRFPNIPSYLRRQAIKKAYGAISSWKSSLADWMAAGCSGKVPGFPVFSEEFPCLYNGNMYERTGRCTAKIKLYGVQRPGQGVKKPAKKSEAAKYEKTYEAKSKVWDWVEIKLKTSDVNYIETHCASFQVKPPTLYRDGKRWLLRPAFTTSTEFTDKPVMERVILAVDLGLNRPCVCTVMRADGTVLARKFAYLKSDIGSLEHALNQIKRAQQHGSRSMPCLWRRVIHSNEKLAADTSAFIIECAVQYHVDVVVFEHLDLNGKKRGSKRQKLHHWKARAVQNTVTTQAHLRGIRVSHVNAWGTSRLAFDGSGKAERGKYIQNGKEMYNYSICVFPNGKQYDCDLNAAYNIGARYFIREILKSLPETARLDIQAKVPECSKRSTCVLASLIRLNAALASRNDKDGEDSSEASSLSSACI